VLDQAVIVLRFAQYGAAAVLLGLPLFFLFAWRPETRMGALAPPWPRALLVVASGGLLVASAIGLFLQIAVMAGSLSGAFEPAAIAAVVTGMGLGKSALVRSGVALVALLIALVAGPGRRTWVALGTLGAVAIASFPWMGHGAATEGAEGWAHLAADIVHGWAAALWIGALVGFLVFIRAARLAPELTSVLHGGLHRFSGLGTLLVATLVASGIVNSWFLVGPDQISGLWTSDYGRLLLLKIVLFIGMLVLAAANRFRHTHALGLGLGLSTQRSKPAELGALHRSVLLEATLGFSILALVAWFGTLPPPASHAG